MQATELPRIADIIPPTAPAAAMSTGIVVALALITLLAIALLLFYRRSLHAQLMRLRLKRRYLCNRDIALELRALIHNKHRQGLEQGNDRQWQAYARQLQHACFSHMPPADEALDSLLAEGRYWLMQK